MKADLDPSTQGPDTGDHGYRRGDVPPFRFVPGYVLVSRGQQNRGDTCLPTRHEVRHLDPNVQGANEHL